MNTPEQPRSLNRYYGGESPRVGDTVCLIGGGGKTWRVGYVFDDGTITVYRDKAKRHANRPYRYVLVSR